MGKKRAVNVRVEVQTEDDVLWINLLSPAERRAILVSAGKEKILEVQAKDQYFSRPQQAPQPQPQPKKYHYFINHEDVIHKSTIFRATLGDHIPNPTEDQMDEAIEI